MQPLNWRMIAHPMNWLTIILMLLIAGVAGHLLLSLFSVEPTTANESEYQNLPAGQTTNVQVAATMASSLASS